MSPKPALPSKKLLKEMPYEEVANMAAEARVRLHLENRKVLDSALPQRLWRIIRSEEDPKTCQPYFRNILAGPVYKKLLDIKMRRVTLSNVEEVVFLREICRDVAKLTGDALLEDLIMKPGEISPKDKQTILTTVGALYERVLPKEKPNDEAQPEIETLGEGAIEQADSLEQALANMPTELRERYVKRWKLGELNSLNERAKELLGGGSPTEKAV